MLNSIVPLVNTYLTLSEACYDVKSCSKLTGLGLAEIYELLLGGI